MKFLVKTIILLLFSAGILLLSFLFLPFLILFLILPAFFFGFRTKSFKWSSRPPENENTASNIYKNNEMNESDTVYDVEFEVLEDKKIIPEKNEDDGKE